MRSLVVFILVKCFLLKDNFVETSRPGSFDVGKPLILTPLLEDNKIPEAQRVSRVRPDIANTTSYSGYLTVNKACESNLFFWFFPAQKNWEQAPLVLFLQGGPGASSIYSLFQENGPLTVKDGVGVGRRKYSWNVENNLLFIDQPVGTGFSFTGKGCYAENETVIGEELYSAVVQFLQLFPGLRSNTFFITGYSYAGHFIPALGYTIHKNNPSARIKINLAGMMIGNGWMDAVYQNDLGSYLYQLGLIDDEGRDVYYQAQEQFSQHMKNKEYQKALEIRGSMVTDLYLKQVGNVSILNYLRDIVTDPVPYEEFIQSPRIRKAIHVGNTNWSFTNSQVETKLGVDPVLSVKPWVEELLEHYFIVFYAGQLDIICAYPTQSNFLKNLNWSGAAEFKKATRQKWCVKNRQAGYFKGSKNLYDVIVRDAGHAVPYEQPEWGYVLVNTVTSGPRDNPLQDLDICQLAV